MKRTFSICLMATMLICSIGVGVSGFSSSTMYQRLDVPTIERQYHTDDFGTLKFIMNEPVLKSGSYFARSSNDMKPDNTLYQIVHWNQMQYYTKL